MMGFGYYANGGGSSASSSNLSASAPPFTVDRSAQKPIPISLVDFSEPSFNAPLNSSLHNWINPHSANSFPESGVTPSLNTYRYSGPQTFKSPSAHMPPLHPYASTDSVPYPLKSDGIPELYYPCYVSSAVQPGYDVLPASDVTTFKRPSDDGYTPALSDMKHTAPWGGGWEQFKGANLSGTCSLKDMDLAASSLYRDHIDPGAHTSKGPNKCEVSCSSRDMLSAREKQIECTGAGKLECNSFVERSLDFSPSGFLGTSILEPAPIFPESYPAETSLKPIDCRSNQVKYDCSYEKCMKQHGASQNDGLSFMKSSPGVSVALPAVGTSTWVPSIGPSKNVYSGNDATDMNILSSNPNSKETSPLLSSEGKVLVHGSHLDVQLEGNDLILPKSSCTEKEHPSQRSVFTDVLGHLFEPTPDFQGSQIGPDSFTFSVDRDEAIITHENACDSLDYYSPPVDSPCWRGAPFPHYLSFEASKVASPQVIKKPEGCNFSSHQGSQFLPTSTDDSGKLSFQNPSQDSVSHESRFLYNSLAPSPERPSSNNALCREDGSDDGTNKGSSGTKRNPSHVIQSSDVIDEPRKEDAMSNHSFDGSDLMPFQIFQQGIEEGRLTSKKKNISGSSIADVGMNMMDASDCVSSHRPFHATKDSVLSPSSVEDVPAKPAESLGGESPPKISVLTLLSTMNNLSELLLYHCSENAFELKEEEHEALKNVVSNLNKCAISISRQTSPTQEALFSQLAASEQAEHHEDVNVISPRVSKVTTADFLDESDNQHVREEKKHHTVSSDAERLKDDKMTQDIKKVLTDNFPDEEEMQPEVVLYKNLWLEAEAKLCSITYMARFNRVKTEMEKCKLHIAKDLTAMLTEAESPPGSKDLRSVENSEPVISRCQAPVFSDQDPSTLGAPNHLNDVMTRFHILKCREDHSNSLNAKEAGDLISSEVSPDPHVVGKSKPVTDSDPTHFSIQDSSFSGASTILNDLLPKFYIPKCQVDNLNAISAIHAENLSSFEVSPDLGKVDELTEVNGSSIANMSNQDSFASGSASQSNDLEASVMARLQILKSQCDNSSFRDVEQQQKQQVLDIGFAGERKHCSIIGDTAETGTLDVDVQPISGPTMAPYTGDELTVKEFYLHVKDDPVIQPRWTNMFGNQLPAVGHDSSSSDWEHVLKEELVS